jgi:hypothetical protein
MSNFLQTQNPTGQVTQLVTTNGSETVISAPGGGTGGGIPTPATSHIVFASPVFGSDTTGDGTEDLPYATIAKAYSTITTASAVDIWQVVLFAGEYVENVALKPFVRTEGWDKAKQTSGVYPAHINGNVTLDAGFSVAGATAWVTAVDIDGTTTLDFVAAASTDGSVSFAGCQFEVNIVLTQGPSNSTEMHECTLLDDCVQLGGSLLWENTVGGSGGSSALRIAATTGGSASGALFSANNSSWVGNVQADQNANSTDNVQIDLNNSQFRGGTLTITAAGSNNPIINGAYGSTPENPVFAGSSAAGLSPQMRVSLEVIVPGRSVIAAAGTTDATIPLSGGVLGATSIEDMNCACTLTGIDWRDLFTAQDLSVSWVFVDNGGAQEIHCMIYTPGAGFTAGIDLPVRFTAYLPEPTP